MCTLRADCRFASFRTSRVVSVTASASASFVDCDFVANYLYVDVRGSAVIEADSWGPKDQGHDNTEVRLEDRTFQGNTGYHASCCGFGCCLGSGLSLCVRSMVETGRGGELCSYSSMRGHAMHESGPSLLLGVVLPKPLGFGILSNLLPLPQRLVFVLVHFWGSALTLLV